MSSKENRCTQPNNEKKRNEDMIRKVNESINPYVTTRGNILVSECCGAEMLYNISDKYGFNMWNFCPQCLDYCNTLEVDITFDSDKYMELLKNDNENQLNKIQYADDNVVCPYCEDGNVDIAENVEQMSDSVIWCCHECVAFFEIDDKGNIAIEEGSEFGQNKEVK